MKILHIIYTNAVAGAEKYLLTLLPGLAKFNIECHLICVCPERSKQVLITYSEKLFEDGIKTTVMTGNKINFLNIAGSINNYLIKEKITIVHSHLSNADLIAVLIKLIYNRKITIISSKHGYDEKYLFKYDAKAAVHKIDRNLYYYYTKVLLKYIDFNLGISKALSELYVNIRLSKKPYYFIHHGIHEIPNINQLENKDATKTKLIIIGRLEKVKGQQYVLKALPHILQKAPDTTLLILGDGGEKDNLVELATKLGIEKNVTFLSFRKNPYELIRSCDVMIQTSSFESFGLVFLEAFALKVPVIAFDVPAANEIIIHNETGILVPKLNTEILAEEILLLIKNPDERNRISENAYQMFLKHYTANRMIEQTANWYKSLPIKT